MSVRARICGRTRNGSQAMKRKTAHISIVVHDVIGQLEFVEGHDLFRPLTTAARRVGVHVDTAGHLRVSLAGHDPAGCVKRVAVSFVVAWHEVHHHHVVGRQVEPEQTNLEGREHPSEDRTTASWSEMQRQRFILSIFNGTIV